MSEPEDDMTCCDLECCEEIKNKQKEESSPLRKIKIDNNQLTNSPLKDLDEKMSPIRSSIHEVITSEAAFERHDIKALLCQIESMQSHIDTMTIKT